MRTFFLGEMGECQMKEQKTSQKNIKKRTQARVAKLKELYSSFGFESLHEEVDACQQRDFKPLSFLPAVEFTITSMI